MIRPHFRFSRIFTPYIEDNVAQSVGMEGYLCWKVLKRAHILNIEDNVGLKCGDAGGKRKSANFKIFEEILPLKELNVKLGNKSNKKLNQTKGSLVIVVFK